MTTKEIAIESIQKLPETATWEDIQEQLLFVAGIKVGLDELDSGQAISHEEVKKQLYSWITD